MTLGSVNLGVAITAHLREELNILQDNRFILGQLLVDVRVLAAARVVGDVAREEVRERDGGRTVACKQGRAMSRQIE